VIVSSFDFKSKVKSAVFSPDSSLLAVGAGRTLEVWRAPQLNTAAGAAIHFTSLAFAPLTRVRDYQPAFDRITCMDWSSDSKFICYGSRDMMVRVQAVRPFKVSAQRLLHSCPSY
jgi:WD40 repeat protein